ncbi:erythrocyte membrane protein 1, PfEMP1, putative [Plasmodium reichenowi]|uniref:Erythrocyte membrane protein 1, PfEMP1, putative n=1 Tax=Plasmodium reichenowi TaxID=5854 RepID=A0A2P9D5H9_PLARE|nr:erythrocyte membrane protein 1, PfEMP1, putative [Plasmodium reichenowi]
MVPKPSVASAATTIDYTKVTNVKELFDEIGKTVHKKVRGAAIDYVNDLKGHLERARFIEGSKVESGKAELCNLQHDYHTNVTTGRGREYPCSGREPVRFSDTQGAQCDDKKIEGNKDNQGNNGGACAPYRRLNLCDQHLSHMQADNIDDTHKLLLEVCLAAQYEGQTISADHAKHKLTYPGYHSELCTELARSFADIGDIIRGKDLYRGNKKEKDRRKQLEDKLKEIFKKIYDNLMDDLSKDVTNGKTKENAEKRYNKKKDPNFYQLREDWWELNRKDVWKAITCESGSAQYVGLTCSEGGSSAKNHCTCIIGDVPTYFDYVPQFLRWFEEWAEDFCRKKKKYVDIVKTNCRGKHKEGMYRYCSRNGFDCEETINRIGHVVMGKQCTDCLYACNSYEKWIDNQKKEFLKQKKKCDNQISNPVRKKKGETGNYEGYDEQFYEKLKEGKYGKVDAFLELLNKENVCTKITTPEEGEINFKEDHGDINNNNKEKGTFYRSKYCQVCPNCGVKHIVNGKFRDREENEEECKDKKLYNPTRTVDPTNIKILISGDGHDDIVKKIDNFCNKPDREELYELWKCYYEKSNNEACIKEKFSDGKVEKQKSYNDFFTYWVAHMLKDSIYWKTEKVEKCLKNEKKKCGKNCNNDCNCFERWVQQKKDEWDAIKKHFDKQHDIKKETNMDPGEFLGHYLKVQFSKENYQEGSEKNSENSVNAKEIDLINKMLKDEENAETQVVGDTDNEQNTTIDKLLKHEKKEADKCKKCTQTHNKDPCDNGNYAGRSGAPRSQEEESDSEDDEDKPKVKDRRTNPCYGNNNTEYPVLAHKVAQTLQEEAHEEAKGRALSKLKGDIKQAEFKTGDKGSELDNCNICSIDEEKHTNDSRKYGKGNGEHQGPCTGKGEGFNIGTEWKPGNSNSSTPNVYIRPRREHMCTSNLEKIEVDNVTKKGNVNASFLVDVLLAAKEQADFIKKKYKNGNTPDGFKDDATKCRAMKYSFADIGDIIRGIDLWYQNGDATGVQNNLEKIFKVIKEKLPNGVKDNYTGDDTKLKKLRSDWWEANRGQVWRAMKCAEIGGDCGGDVPLDDYIPQRLRWMTEWAEWFCKAQSQEYEKLETHCDSCKVDVKGENCYKTTPGCTLCKTACDAYKTKIQKWADQWTPMQIQYHTLYPKAGTSAGTVYVGYPDKQQVAHFFKELQTKYKTATSGNDNVSPYESAAGYVHQEARTGECEKQTLFCNSGDQENKDKNAFKRPPHEYKDACNCTKREAPAKKTAPEGGTGEPDGRARSADSGDERPSRPPPPPPVLPVPQGPDPCQIVEELFKRNDFKEACSQKYGHPQRHWGWKCVNPTKTGSSTATRESSSVAGKNGVDSSKGSETDRAKRHTKEASDSNGAICVPPRRRKLYVEPLKTWAEETAKRSKSLQNGDSSEATPDSQEAGSNGQTASESTGQTATQQPNPLLEAFIQSAAIETFFLWHQYKQLHKTEDDTSRALGNHSTGDSGSYSTGLFGSSNSNIQALPSPVTLGQPGPDGSYTPGPVGPPGPQGLQSPLTNGEDSGSWTDNAYGLRSLNGPGRNTENELSPAGGPPLNNRLQLQPLPSVLSSDNSDDSPQSQLLSGKIPPDFLRQMFYTLGDYRDICIGKTPSGIDEVIVSGGSGNDKDKEGEENSKMTMETIRKAIEKHFSNSDVKSPRDTVGSSRGKVPSQSSDNPSSWWKDHAPQIWHGMICALTYEESEGKEQPPVVDDTVRGKLWDSGKNEPKNPDYKYDQVKLKDNDSDTKAISNDNQPPTLKDFVLRPPYFRYLQEWGEEFCKKRTEMLKNVRKACREKDDGDPKYCGGYGHDCEEPDNQHNKMSADLYCGDCLKECRKYKKWIQKKENEFNNQNSKYGEESQKVITSSNNGGGNVDNTKFYEELKQKTTAPDFLAALKHCSNDESDSDENNDEDKKNNKLDFGNLLQTFSRSTYCKACPVYGVTCNSRTRGRSCTNINEEVYKKKKGITGGNVDDKHPTKIEVLVLGRTADVKDKYDDIKNACKNTGLLEDTCVQNWECQKKNGIHECNLNGAGETVDSKYFEKKISFKILFHSWVIDFIEHYNKSKKTINLCTQNVHKKGIEGCKGKCKCVEKWLEIKKAEWEKIKKYYKQHFKADDEHIAYTVKIIFEKPPFNIHAKEAQEVVDNACDKQQLWGCTDKNLTNGDPNNCDKEDFITNLIKELEKKIRECTSQTSDEPCTGTLPQPQPLDLDDEEENPENKVGKEPPTFCKIEDTQPKVVEEEKCEEAKPPSTDTGSTSDVPKDEKKDDKGEGNGDLAPVNPTSSEETNEKKKTEQDPVKDQPETPKPLPRPQPPNLPKPPPKVEKNPFEHPAVIPSLATSTLAWSVGIGFAALTYWLLKKKTKSSVDMLRVLQIPQNDYGIPTKRSPNRYVPYRSAQYRGKRYIYLEGDSGTDSGYTDHYSDITSSSESEYEEFDINDIYVPGSPKYKTLIEVVLEPSKRDTQSGDTIPNSDNTITNSGNTILNSDNTIPTSDNTIPTSDTPNTYNDTPNTPSDIPNTPSDTPPPITDDEWNELKQHFISGILENEQKDVPNDYTSGNSPTNTNNTTMSSHNVDNNTHPTPSHNKLDQKPFIMSIHDRNLLSGEEYNYDMSTNSVDSSYSGIDPTSDNHGPYSGIDLINDSLNSGNHDIYNELLKRKENELFGTNHVKHTSTHSVAKPTNSDPIMNQLDLFHKWLDRHRDMYEKWEKHDERLSKLKEEWENDNNNSGNKTSGNITPTSGNIHPNDIPSGKLSDTPSDNNIHSGNKHSDIPSGKLSDIPSGKLSDIPSANNIHSDIPYVLNSDVSIQIHMDDPKPTSEFSNMDTYPNNFSMDSILEDLEKYNEPYYDVQDDIYYDVNDHDTSTVDSNNMDVPSKVKIEMSVKNTQMMEEKYPIGDVWDI